MLPCSSPPYRSRSRRTTTDMSAHSGPNSCCTLFKDGNLMRIFWIHARQQQRRDLHLILATLRGSQAGHLKHTLFRLCHCDVSPELLTGQTGRIVPIEHGWVARATGDTANEGLAHSLVALEVADAECDHGGRIWTPCCVHLQECMPTRLRLAQH